MNRRSIFRWLAVGLVAALAAMLLVQYPLAQQPAATAPPEDVADPGSVDPAGGAPPVAANGSSAADDTAAPPPMPVKPVDGAPRGPAVGYPPAIPGDRQEVQRLTRQSASKAGVNLVDRTQQEGRPVLTVTAPADVPAEEIRGVIQSVRGAAPNVIVSPMVDAAAPYSAYPGARPGGDAQRQRIANLARKLRDEPGDHGKAQARKALRAALAEAFDADMQARQKQVDQIESRLRRLRDQFQAREKLKEEILSLQLKVLESTGESLDFLPSGRANGGPNSSLTGAPAPAAVPSTPEPVPSGAYAPNSPRPAASARAGGPPYGVTTSPTTQSETAVSDYARLREQFSQAKAELQSAEEQFNALLADDQRRNPVATIEDAKREHPLPWKVVEAARAGYEDAKRLYDTKLELLRLDVKAAENTVGAAKAKLGRMQDAFKAGAVTDVEFVAGEAALKATEIELQRARTLLELFESIGRPSSKASEPSPSGAPKR